MNEWNFNTKSLPSDILDSLTKLFLQVLERNYIKANEFFLEMAIGNAPWPIGATMVGIHARPGRERIASKHVARNYILSYHNYVKFRIKLTHFFGVLLGKFATNLVI